MKIFSRELLTEEDFKKIEDILRESNCPHESLTNTFPRYSGMIDDIITFDGISPQDMRDKNDSTPD